MRFDASAAWVRGREGCEADRVRVKLP